MTFEMIFEVMIGNCFKAYYSTKSYPSVKNNTVPLKYAQ